MNPPSIRIRTVVSLVLFCGYAAAAIRTVTNLNDNGAGSLRATIAAASSGDTVNFALSGTITLTSGILEVNKSLTISGPGSITVARSLAGGTPEFGIFSIYNGSSNLVVSFSNLTIRNGATRDGGGAIHSSFGDTVTVTNCHFAGNVSKDCGGGAIYSSGGVLAVNGCTFTDNTADLPYLTNPGPDGGGAINMPLVYDHSGTLTVTASTFTDNAAYTWGGGAIACQRWLSEPGGTATVRIEGCTFNGNKAETVPNFAAAGGAVVVNQATGTAELTISNCSFTANTSDYHGGAVFSDCATSSLRDSFFASNSATSGGAVFNVRAMTVENCTFSGNSAFSPSNIAGKGGGLFSHSTLAVFSCTFSGNTANFGAGGIHKGGAASAGRLSLGNNLFKAASPGGRLIDENGNTVSYGYNLSSDGGGGLLAGTGDQINVDPQLDPLGPQNNGGPTKTTALLSTSPALDRGKVSGLTRDQRGRQRPVELAAHPNAAGGDGSDIGAFESGDPLASPLVVTTLHDHEDGVAGESDCTLREAIARTNALGNAQIYFLSGLQGTLALDRNIGPLVVTGGADIYGPGARVLAISAGGYMRVFHYSGPTSGGRLYGLTIRDGSVSGAPGASGAGGGVYNEGLLICNDCTFDAHSVHGSSAITLGGHGADGYGGGIYNAGELWLLRCTFRSCLAAGGYGMDDPSPGGVGIPPGRGGNGGSARGGAIYHAGSSLKINHCTFHGNNASGGGAGNGARFGGGGGNGQGGAIFSNQSQMLISGTTVVDNLSLGGSRGLGSNSAFDGPSGTGSGAVTAASGGGIATVRGTVIAANVRNGSFPADVAGAFASGAFNLLGSADGSTGFSNSTDQKGTNAALLNPMLGALQNNGGQTDTRAPLAGSALIDKGHSFGLTTDQRGLPRPIDAQGIPNASGGDGSEIGAVEVDGLQTGPEFVVNSLDDHDDGSASFFDCTLREALIAAFYATGADTVRFQPGLTGTITLNPFLGNLTIYDSVTLIGPGARRLTVQRQAGVEGRVLTVNGGRQFISGLTLYGGTLSGGNGGASTQGAAILSQGILTVSDCAIIRNTASGGNNDVFPGQPGGSGAGGGVANIAGGILTLNRCSLALNSVYGGRGFQDASSSTRGGDASGGAVFNDTGCTLTVVNCTFNDNAATGGNSGNANSFVGVQGGAGEGVICNRGTMTITAATLRGGFGAGGASGFTIPRGAGVGGIFAAAGSTNLVRNTLCAANVGNFVPSDISGTFTSGGYNLVGNGDTGAGFTAASDQRGTATTPIDARFGTFYNYGGPTDTVGLQPNSPALDLGKNFGLPTDQRGAARTFDNPAHINAAGGDGTDIGAFETVPVYTGPPYFVSIKRASSEIQIQMQGDYSAYYQLQTGSNLSGGFINVGSPVRADFLGLVDFFDASPLSDRRFYRAVRSP